MIIDFHTHAFPDKIAVKTVDFLKEKSHTVPTAVGTVQNLSEKALAAGIDLSIVLPVVTNPLSTDKINSFAAEINEKTKDTGVFSFGGVHPDTQDLKAALKRVKDSGLKGVKIHPPYQQVKLNDIRYKRIFGLAEEYGLIVISHGGYDIGVEGDFSSPAMAREICREIKPSRFVMAHTGGWQYWDDVKKYLCGEALYFDTAFSVGNFYYRDDFDENLKKPVLGKEEFLEIIRAHGVDKVLFGTDSPWADQKDQIEFMKSLPLKESEKENILGGNAAKLLGI
ncbi:MAG: amidohydrolase family protein [Clostridia bacterium]|nr:amidohydrolase family protein [Clostridia bacterium]